MKKHNKIRFLLILALAALLLQACATPAGTLATTAAVTAEAAETTQPAADTPASTAAPTPEPTATPTQAPAASPTPEPTASPAPTVEAGAPNIIGLYELRKSHNLLTEHKTKWIAKKNIGVFFALATNDATVDHPRHRTTLLNYWSMFPKADEYKIGYYVQIALKSGETKDITIRSALQVPKDPDAYFYKYIEVYLYDDIHLNRGETYATYHLVKKSITPETLMTSIKLHPGVKYKDVTGIKLMAFVFKDDNDFDPSTGKYIGPVSYEISIERTN